ncbi:MAG: 50S ribosomal protein L24 [Candidatus Pacebacteria bacterium]|nr:50S ribosomal protein L24 [Candidatus Paceibacterota bacterium]
MNIKKGDTVLIRKGRDKGKTGKVIKVLPAKNKVVIESLNLVKKIQKAKKGGEKSEIITVPRPIARSNVMLICPNCKKPTKISNQKDNGLKFRICKKCGSRIS